MPDVNDELPTRCARAAVGTVYRDPLDLPGEKGGAGQGRSAGTGGGRYFSLTDLIRAAVPGRGPAQRTSTSTFGRALLMYPLKFQISPGSSGWVLEAESPALAQI